LEDLLPIAHPLAQRRLAKKLQKTIKKGLTFTPLYVPQIEGWYVSLASKARQVKRGVKEVVKGIRKGEKGYISRHLSQWNFTDFFLFKYFRLLVLAADINPMDIISHLPVMSEEAGIPYVFVTSKEELGHASSTKRPTSCVMICPNQKRKIKKEEDREEKDDDYRELYEECFKDVEKLDTKVVFWISFINIKLSLPSLWCSASHIQI